MDVSGVMETFVSRLNRLMLERGMRRHQLVEQMSELLGSSGETFANRTFRRISAPGVPKLDELLALSEIFGVSVGYLIGETDERGPVEDVAPDYPPDVMRLITHLLGQRRRLPPPRERRWRRIDER